MLCYIPYLTATGSTQMTLCTVVGAYRFIHFTLKRVNFGLSHLLNQKVVIDFTLKREIFWLDCLLKTKVTSLSSITTVVGAYRLSELLQEWWNFELCTLLNSYGVYTNDLMYYGWCIQIYPLPTKEREFSVKSATNFFKIWLRERYFFSQARSNFWVPTPTVIDQRHRWYCNIY